MSAVFIIVRWSIVVNYGSVFASIFIKDGSLYPMLKETIKAAFKLLSFFLSFYLENWNNSYFGHHTNTLGSCLSVRNLPK